jgi:hypothetical protein
MAIRLVVTAGKAWKYLPIDFSLAKIYPDIMDTVADAAFDHNERLVPRRTGQLQESFGVQMEAQFRRIRISWTAPYANFVDEGVPESPGRYVPAIDKRLVNPSKRNPTIGIHPGFDGRHFIDKMLDALKDEMVQITQQEIQRRWMKE